jgi:hypothetical protein
MTARLLLLVLLVAGCGPHIDPVVRGGCVGVGNPALCERVHQADLDRFRASVARADMAVAPVSHYAPQRVYIRRWLVPGARNNPAPLGFVDIP